MKSLIYTAIFAFATLYAAGVSAVDPHKLKVTADGLNAKGYISPEFAFCVPDAKSHMKEGNNMSIGLSWSQGPAATKSYAIIAVDPDVPVNFDDAGKEGKTLSADMPRRNFYHWVLLDIPASITSIPVHADSHTISKHGKSDIETPFGKRGVNDYAGYFAGSPEHKGTYAGYDGPCPPWNDARIHHYHFKVFALDIPSLGISGTEATGDKSLKTMEKHILAQGEIIGKYTLNPTIKK
jgi:hypothetical protein